mmetsp:Transcript_78968/g.128021  ORF Transcript_78968/g.128021 Transcript_78968/m.128021 type:complete len:566 (-) Transcript_78968:371-2068(-)
MAGSSEADESAAWPPLYAVVYSIGDNASQVYFPLELSSTDYAARILRNAGHVLRQVYEQIQQDDLAPPSLEEGRIVDCQTIDNTHLFAYILSANVSLVYSRLLKIDVESLRQGVQILCLAESDMIKAPVPKYWTQVKVRRLFDAALRLVEAGAQGGFGQWTSLNLSSLRSQYKRHMKYRDERLLTAFPHGTLSPSEELDELDAGWAMEENKFWRPKSPDVVVKSKAQRATEKDEILQQEVAAAARVMHLQKVANWEQMFARLSIMDKTKVDDGTAERLRKEVLGRLEMMHRVSRAREAEAQATRLKQFEDAWACKERLDAELLPLLRAHEENVEALWKEIAPAELVDSASGLEHDSLAHAQDAANARDYVTARTLSEVQERLAAARQTLAQRSRHANIMAERAMRSNVVAIMREDVRELVVASNALEPLDELTQPPFDLLDRAARLDLGIQKWTHTWTTEKGNTTSDGNTKAHSKDRSASTALAGSALPSPTSSAKRAPRSNHGEQVLSPEEGNDTQRVADILAMRNVADDVTAALKRLRYVLIQIFWCRCDYLVMYSPICLCSS